jgi:hypothetical protein
MDKNMRRKIFKLLLKRYSKTERNRLEIMEELWKGIIDTYSEQTYPGNIQNMQIEMIMSNPWIRFAASSHDTKSVDFIKSNIRIGTSLAISYLEKENEEITKDGFDALINFHSIRKK